MLDHESDTVGANDGHTTNVSYNDGQDVDDAHYLITIHGTGDSEPTEAPVKWWQEKSDFLSRILENSEATFSHHIPFMWDGQNSQTSRLDAASKLGDTINNLPNNAKFSVVAHSHGGNVLIYALQRIRRLPERLAQGILIGTPPLREKAALMAIIYVLMGLLFLFAGLATAVTSFVNSFADDYSERVAQITYFSFYLIALVLGLVLSSGPKRFFLAGLIITFWFGLLAFILVGNLFEWELTEFLSDKISPWIEGVWFFIATLGFAVFCCFLVGFACFRRGLSALMRERRRRKTLRAMSGRLSLILHPSDEVIALLKNAQKLKVQPVSGEMMSKTLSGALISFLMLGAVAYAIYLIVDQFGQSIAAVVAPAVVVAGLYIMIRSVSGIASRVFGSVMANRLNSTVRKLGLSFAFGSDTPDAVVYDEKAISESLVSLKLSDKAQVEMIELASERAADTARQNVRSGNIIAALDGKSVDAFSWVTFKELVHCGYFLNAEVAQLVSSELKPSR